MPHGSGKVCCDYGAHGIITWLFTALGCFLGIWQIIVIPKRYCVVYYFNKIFPLPFLTLAILTKLPAASLQCRGTIEMRCRRYENSLQMLRLSACGRNYGYIYISWTPEAGPKLHECMWIYVIRTCDSAHAYNWTGFDMNHFQWSLSTSDYLCCSRDGLLKWVSCYSFDSLCCELHVIYLCHSMSIFIGMFATWAELNETFVSKLPWGITVFRPAILFNKATD